MVNFVELVIPSPQLVLLAIVALMATMLFWFFYPKYWKKKREVQSPSLAWEIIGEPPGNRQDLYITDHALNLIGPDYKLIGNMPANFICPQCRAAENVELKMYHHLPSHTMVILTRHGCQLPSLYGEETVQLPVVQGGAQRVQGSTKTF